MFKGHWSALIKVLPWHWRGSSLLQTLSSVIPQSQLLVNKAASEPRLSSGQPAVPAGLFWGMGLEGEEAMGGCSGTPRLASALTGTALALSFFPFLL